MANQTATLTLVIEYEFNPLAQTNDYGYSDETTFAEVLESAKDLVESSRDGGNPIKAVLQHGTITLPATSHDLI